MFLKKSIVGLVAVVLTFSSALLAQNARSSSRAKERANYHAHNAGDIRKATPSVRRREIRQKVRIAEGVKSGELNKEESRELLEGQKEVKEMKKEARSDGEVTAQERLEIQKKLNEESREIYREKHDGDTNCNMEMKGRK